MIITAGNDRQFRALCEVLGIPDVPDDPQFASNADRTRNREPLRVILVAELAKWKADDLFVALNKAGVPCGPINTIAEGVELGTGDRAVSLVRNPIGFGDAELSYDLPPPELGENSDEIRSWLRTSLEHRDAG
jgi:crotonobetainyl-CoA:carnitine CoA-transferase CaiB-like acyl-CoA transferase